MPIRDLEARLMAALAEARALQGEHARLRHHDQLMMREAHHRIANHLQLIISGAAWKRNTSNDPALRNFADAIIGQIRAVAGVHAMLAQAPTNLDFGAYIARLCDGLAAVSATPEAQIEVNILPVAVDAAQFVPAGLIVTELITNSQKHALLRGHGGKIVVEVLPQSSDVTVMTVADDGDGFPAVVQKGCGLGVVEALARSMGGSVEFGPGANVLVAFPNKRPRQHSAP